MSINSFNLFNCNIPEEYRFEEDDGVLSIYNEENGVGALQITSYRIPNGYRFNIKDELIEFILSNDDTLKSKEIDKDIVLNNNSGVFQVKDNEGYWWKYWLLFRNNIAIFITYNCEIDYLKVEENVINKIVESISISRD